MSNAINDLAQFILESWPGQILLVFGLISPLLGWISHIYDPPPVPNRNFALQLATIANFFLILIIFSVLNGFKYSLTQGLIICLLIIPISTVMFYFSYKASTKSLNSSEKDDLNNYMIKILTTTAAFAFLISSLNTVFFSELPRNFSIQSCLKVDENIGLGYNNYNERKYQVEEVKSIQKELKRGGFYEDNIDGKYDNNLKAAISKFQRRENLKQDGIAGCKTQRELFDIDLQCCS